jgi:hypothetical protein
MDFRIGDSKVAGNPPGPIAAMEVKLLAGSDVGACCAAFDLHSARDSTPAVEERFMHG